MFLILLIPFIYGLYKGIKEGIPVNNDDEEVDEKILEEITMIQCNINRRIESAYILENELQQQDIKPLKKARLLNQLNTLDKQTFKDYKRIEQLENEIIKDG
jgi:ribosomal 50S subunit-associated protein YjgA (DUF615 family)